MARSVRNYVKCSITVFLIYITVASAQFQNYPQSNRVYTIGRSIRDSDNVERVSFINGKKYGGINKQLLQPDVGLVDSDRAEQKLKRETGCCDNEMPLDFAEKLNAVSDEANFIDEFIDKETYDPREKIFNRRFANNPGLNETIDVERGAAIRPKPASCIPDIKVVPLRPEDDTDSSIVYYPSCTRVKQCGGCCSHKLLSCQPVETQTLTFELIKSQYTGGNKLKYIGKDIALIEEHTKCRCDCAVKEKDCKPFQKYNKPQCKCECTNEEDQAKCYQESELKIWDSANCQCKCREEKDCTTGSYYDQNQCKCIQKNFYRT